MSEETHKRAERFGILAPITQRLDAFLSRAMFRSQRASDEDEQSDDGVQRLSVLDGLHHRVGKHRRH